jgi:hypothetical protein
MATYYIELPRELLEHDAHLPEVISCACGYVRPEKAA